MRSFGTYLLKLFASSILLSILFTSILLVSKEWFLDYFLEIITDFRGTTHYKGENKEAEYTQVVKFIVYPTVLAASFIVSLLTVKLPLSKRKKRKKKKKRFATHS